MCPPVAVWILSFNNPHWLLLSGKLFRVAIFVEVFIILLQWLIYYRCMYMNKSSFWISILYIFTHTYIYIYIYCHPQTDCFILSGLFSVARHVGRSKPRLKPIQLYLRLSLRPLGHLRAFLRYLCHNSSSVRLFTFLYPIGSQSAQFFRRALHYASGGRKFLRYIYIYIHLIHMRFHISYTKLYFVKYIIIEVDIESLIKFEDLGKDTKSSRNQQTSSKSLGKRSS